MFTWGIADPHLGLLPRNRLTAAKARLCAAVRDGAGASERKAGRHHKTTEEETTDETGSSKKSERHKEKSAAEPTATP